MEESRSGSLRQAAAAAFPLTIPVFTGFLVLGMAYGVLMQTNGYGAFWSTLMSAVAFSVLVGVVDDALGGLLGSVIPFSTEGLDFALTALFVVLFLGQLENAGSRIYGLIGTVCSLAVLLLAGVDNMVIPSMIVILIVLLIGRKRI